MLNNAYKEFQRLPAWPVVRGRVGDNAEEPATTEGERQNEGSWGGFGVSLQDWVLQDAEPQH